MAVLDGDHLFVMTGGPGSGKTTLIAALERAGFNAVHEAGRRIIKEQMATGGRALPWADRARFASAMLDHDIAAHETWRRHRRPVFFDRGIPDVLGYLDLVGLSVSQSMREAAQVRRYNRTVFIAPPWPAIFAQDDERKQTPEEAERTYHAMTRVYAEYGYALLELPRASVAERVRFVLQHAGAR
jgi:predicted ATPase